MVTYNTQNEGADSIEISKLLPYEFSNNKLLVFAGRDPKVSQVLT